MGVKLFEPQLKKKNPASSPASNIWERKDRDCVTQRYRKYGYQYT
jgi:hypothetical protein